MVSLFGLSVAESNCRLVLQIRAVVQFSYRFIKVYDTDLL